MKKLLANKSKWKNSNMCTFIEIRNKNQFILLDHLIIVNLLLMKKAKSIDIFKRTKEKESFLEDKSNKYLCPFHLKMWYCLNGAKIFTGKTHISDYFQAHCRMDYFSTTPTSCQYLTHIKNTEGVRIPITFVTYFPF